MPKAGILSLSSYTPEKVLTNHDLEKMVDTSDEWIVTRTGIKQRHIVAEGQATSDISVLAAKKALDKIGLTPEDIDCYILATATPDMLFPSTACLVTAKLGLDKIDGPPAMDIAAGCTGFVYGLSMAKSFIESGMYKKVMVIGAEALSRILDWQDRNTCVLFGDGAGCAIVGEVESGGILDAYLGSWGAGGLHLTLPAGGSLNPASAETVEKRMHYVHMDGSDVFKFAVRAMGIGCKKVLERTGLTADDIDWFIPHQANIRIIESAAKRLGIPMERVLISLDKIGNTSAASVPMTIDYAIAENKIKKGDRLLMVGWAGLTWGAS
ncbi:MAG: beta-ketoacyl-ACP synthase III [Caldisericia bacterium]